MDGVAVSPHNGHLYILYSYGLLAYLLFMYVFFRKRKHVRWCEMMFMIPLFICFTINIGLLDARFSFYMAAIIAFGLRKLRVKRSPKIEPDKISGSC